MAFISVFFLILLEKQNEHYLNLYKDFCQVTIESVHGIYRAMLALYSPTSLSRFNFFTLVSAFSKSEAVLSIEVT